MSPPANSGRGDAPFGVAAWERDRNEAAIAIDWQFTTDDARTKLQRLYPTVKQEDGNLITSYLDEVSVTQ